jgi:hypothetical protein
MWDFAGADDGHIHGRIGFEPSWETSDLLQLLSVGFSTRSARMQAACPLYNTLQGPQSRQIAGPVPPTGLRRLHRTYPH